jgi:hypothetical protein
MRRMVVSLGLLAVLALTGCGGGGDDDDAAPAQTTAAPSTTAAVGNDQAGTPFCGLARTYTEKFSTLLAVANDPVKLRSATTDAEAAIRQAQTTAPAEIRSDVATVATTAKDVLAALQKNNFDLSKTPEVSKLQEPGFQTALGNMNRYARAHCGVA